jgi:hypothetical protein
VARKSIFDIEGKNTFREYNLEHIYEI